jgi:diketogulonate reductase-like aldo/keto reductase
MAPDIVRPLVVNQAEAARLLGVSRFKIRKMTSLGRLKPVNLAINCVHYCISQLDLLIAGI